MTHPVHAAAPTTAYDFTFTRLMGGEALPLRHFAGKVILVVNTASKCGLTGQYAGLETLYKTYKEQGLVIVGVPSNDFAGQEPGSSQDIAAFCDITYGVTFPLANKEHVKGKDAHPFYAWARQTLGFGTAPKWNFHKYLIGRQGQLVTYFNSTTAPDAKRLIRAIEQQLSTPAQTD